MKKRLLFIVATAILGSASYAQRLSPQVLAPAGGIARTATMSLEWTLGEGAIETATTATRIYTQGFHQPILRVEPSAELAGSAYSIEVAPNPVTSTLTVRIDSEAETGFLQLSLTDLLGKAHYSAQAPARQNTRQIDMAGLPAGLYFLQVRSATERLIKSFKIVKN